MEIASFGALGALEAFVDSRETGQRHALFGVPAGTASPADRAVIPARPQAPSLDWPLRHRGTGVAIPRASVEECARQLASMALFRGMPQEELRPLAEATEVVLYQPGERIVSQGDPGESVYLILDGRVEVVARIAKGSIVTESGVAWMTAGDALGELSLLDGQPRSASCIAVTPVTCLRLGREPFLRALREHWSLSRALQVVMAQRLRTADQLLAEHARDPLTGLNNRRALADLYEREAQRARHAARQNGTDGLDGLDWHDGQDGQVGLNPLAVVFVDVNHFKEINDTHGHHTGDEVLKRIAELLTGVSRTTDLVSRYGGDEFVLLLPDAGTHGAELVVSRIRQRLAEQPPGPVPFTVSLGYALVDPQAPQSLDALLTQADHAMYRDKAASREIS